MLTSERPTRVTALDHRNPAEGLERHETRPGETVATRSALAELALQPEVESPLAEIEERRALPRGYRAPPVNVLILRRAWLETRMCTAITSGNEYVRDTLRSHRQAEEIGYRKLGPSEFELPDRTVVELEGKALLVGLPVGRNYFHWMLEAVARWLLGRDHADADTRLVVPAVGRMEMSALAAAGVPEERLLVLPDEALLHVEELIVPPRGVRSSVEILPAAVRAIRDLAEPPGGRGQRLFISRAKAWRRRIANEEELVALLERHGFQIVRTEELDVREQIDLFSTAEAVIGLHGAGLTNAVFAAPGATVIELQPPRLDRSRMVLYWNLAAACGHRYVQVICAEAPDQAETPLSERHVIVDTAHLDGILGRVLAPPI